MTNILFMIVRICHFQFKCNYLKNEKPFLNLLLHFRNLHQILNVSKKRMIVIANVFPKLQKVKILVRHWLQVINILFKIVRFSNSQFRCKYLKTEKLLLDCFFHFRKLHQILYILKKKMIVIATAFPNLRTVKSLVRSLSKKGRFQHTLTVNMWKSLKYLRNLHESTFLMFLHHSQGSLFAKCLP